MLIVLYGKEKESESVTELFYEVMNPTFILKRLTCLTYH